MFMYVRAQKASNTVTFPGMPLFFPFLFFPSRTFSFLVLCIHNVTDLLPALALLRALWDRTESHEKKHTHTRENKGRRERTCLRNNAEEMQKGGQKMDMQSRQRERVTEEKIIEDREEARL